MFVEPVYRDSAEYRAFWAKLGRGEYDAGVYKRIGKGGKEVWIQATYNPIFDSESESRSKSSNSQPT
jgi:methyl-accepting chemotaxis protein